MQPTKEQIQKLIELLAWYAEGDDVQGRDEYNRYWIEIPLRQTGRDRTGFGGKIYQ